MIEAGLDRVFLKNDPDRLSLRPRILMNACRLNQPSVKQVALQENRLLGFQMSTALVLLVLFSVAVFLCDAQEDRPDDALVQRIVGGREAVASRYPWMTAIVQSDDPISYRGFLSGGMLIHPRWVLTAAHSVEGKQPADIQVWVGAGNLMSSLDSVRYSVAEIVRHPGYQMTKSVLGSDLALVRLVERIDIIPNLALSNALGGPRPGLLTRTLGWGRTAGRAFRSPALRSVDIPIVSKTGIDELQIYGEWLPEDIILAGEAAKDTCEGDSGGPLLSIDLERKQWRLLAVVSGGSDLGCAATGTYGLFTSIASHLSWIESIVVEEYDDWASIYGVGNENGDSDGDGFSNRDEYARMTLPLNPRSDPRLIYGLSDIDGKRYATIGGIARLTARDVAFTIEESSDLVDWQKVASLSDRDIIPTSGPKTVFRWQSLVALTDRAPQFFRLMAIQRNEAPRMVINMNSSSLKLTNQ